MTELLWLTRAEVAEMLRLTEKTLANWASAGMGPPYRKIGKYPRYRRDAVEAWADGQPGGGAA